jgi:ribonuclease HI
MAQQQLEGMSNLAPATYTIVFDGGALGNPGRGYGSFKISGPSGDIALERLNLDHIGLRVTNNQAEYRSLIGALELLLGLLGPAAANSTVVIYGDSLLVISQLKGQWKVKNEGLRPLFEQASALLRKFGRSELSWHDRMNSVRLLGH